jgi:hypothetical protein
VTVSDSSTIDEFLSHVTKITGAYRLERVTEVEMFSQISRVAARYQIEATEAGRAHTDADAVLRRWTTGDAA